MIRSIAKQALASRVGWRLLRHVAPDGVRVLTYHRILGEDGCFAGLPLAVFRAQMAWLREHCEPIGLQELGHRLERPGRQRAPVLVSFDDGYRDFADHALPVLREYGIPALVFLPTAFIDGQERLIWTEELDWAFAATARRFVRLPWESGPAQPLGTVTARRSAAARSRAFLKAQDEPERAAWHARLLEALEVEPARSALPRQFLSWDEVRSARDVATFGAHTHQHVILSRVSASTVEQEIRLCAGRIAEELGGSPQAFAYPNGGTGDIGPHARQALARHGFRWAFTTIAGVNTGLTDPLELRRLPTGARTIADFVSLLSGLRGRAA